MNFKFKCIRLKCVWTFKQTNVKIDSSFNLSKLCQFSRSVMSDYLWPHGLQHPRLPCPLTTPRAYSNSYPSSWWYHPPSYPLLSPSPPAFNLCRYRGFSNKSVLCTRWPKYWSFSFSISPSNEYSGVISLRIDWFDLLAVQGTLKSSPTPRFKSINSLAFSFLYGTTLTSIYDYWKNHSFD